MRNQTNNQTATKLRATWQVSNFRKPFLVEVSKPYLTCSTARNITARPPRAIMSPGPPHSAHLSRDQEDTGREQPAHTEITEKKVRKPARKGKCFIHMYKWAAVSKHHLISSVMRMILIGTEVGSSTLNLGTIFVLTRRYCLPVFLKLPFSFQRVSNKQF